LPIRQLLVMILILAIVTGCAQPANPPAIAPTPKPQKTTAMSAAKLSPELQKTVLQAVGKQQKLAPDQLQITQVEEADWPDACLGLAGPDEFCAQMITPGWAITVTHGPQTWQYRTDLDITQVKLEPK
jgi:hypothetical protein